MNLIREFDLTYWQMREALGYSIPDRIDRRWPRKFVGNGGQNPFQCGICAARKSDPGLHTSCDIRWAREHLTGHQLEDFEHRVGLALADTAPEAVAYERGKAHGEDDRRMIERQNQGLQHELDAARAEAAKLQAFKAYVHRRLDAAGVERNPHGPHSAAGCRIGDRLDIVLASFSEGL